SLLVLFDPLALRRAALGRSIASLDGPSPREASAGRLLRIPVVYDGDDLGEVARSSGFDAAEFARRHAGAAYRVAFLGFAPGFAYPSGLPAELASPRRASPRPRVPPGSVAIGGPWTGIYPSELPGGWRLIGRTAARVFDSASD